MLRRGSSWQLENVKLQEDNVTDLVTWSKLKYLRWLSTTAKIYCLLIVMNLLHPQSICRIYKQGTNGLETYSK